MMGVFASLRLVSVVLACTACVSECGGPCFQAPCACHYALDSLSVMCGRHNLTHIPRRLLPRNVTDLDLSENRFRRLDPRSFPPLSSLLSLNLRGCGIQTIAEEAFRNLPALREIQLNHNELSALDFSLGYLEHLHSLSLDHNHLASIEEPVFRGLFLQTLSLQDNQGLSFLAPGAFRGASVEMLSLDRCNLTMISRETLKPLTPSLHALIWSYSLQSLSIPEDTFVGFNFTMLNLIQDGLTSLEVLRGNLSVQSLDVSHNPLGAVDLAGYIGLHNTETLVMRDCAMSQLTSSSYQDTHVAAIHQLDVSSNELSALDHRLFQQMLGLRRLNLTSNRFTSLSLHLMPTFSRLETLELRNMELECDCRLDWFRRWMQETRISVRGVSCADRNATLLHGTPFLCTAPVIEALDAVANTSGVRLSCQASGTPAPAVFWLYTDGDAVPDAAQAWRAVSSRVTLSELRAAGPGCVSVQCVAENTLGRDYRTAHACATGGGDPWPEQSRDESLSLPPTSPFPLALYPQDLSMANTVGWAAGGVLMLAAVAIVLGLLVLRRRERRGWRRGRAGRVFSVVAAGSHTSLISYHNHDEEEEEGDEATFDLS